MTDDLLTRAQIVERVQFSRQNHSPFNPPFFMLPGVRGQFFYILRVDQQDEAYYVTILGWHPIARMPQWKAVDFLLNVEMEE